MLEVVGVVIALLLIGVAVILVLAAMKPDTFRVERTASIKAPPEKIFPFLNDLRSFIAWSPYEKKDPAMKRVYGGPPSGKGATYQWDGNRNVGSGRLEIADSRPPWNVIIKLDMTKPIEAHNIVEFRLEPKGDVTDVTWAMNGRTPFMGKILHVIFNMDRMVGADFEAGLVSLKALAEQGTADAAALASQGS